MSTGYEMSTKKCKACETVLPVDDFYSNGRNGGKKAICKACYAVLRPTKIKHEKASIREDQKCEQCGGAFTDYRKKKFCSTECYHKSKERQVQLQCVVCGKRVSRRKSTAERSTGVALCSSKCAIEHRRQATMLKVSSVCPFCVGRIGACNCNAKWRVAFRQALSETWSAALYRAWQRRRRQDRRTDWQKRMESLLRSLRHARKGCRKAERSAMSGQWEIQFRSWEDALKKAVSSFNSRNKYRRSDKWSRKFANKLSNLRKRRRRLQCPS